MTTISQPNPHHFPASVARLADSDDIAILASKLRPECELEMRSMTGADPLTVLTKDLPATYIIENQLGIPLACLMVSRDQDDPNSAILQVAVSNEVSRSYCGRHVSKNVSEAVLNLHQAGVTNIHSLVDVRNISTASLLRTAGFTFVRRFESFGVGGIAVGLYTSTVNAKSSSFN